MKYLKTIFKAYLIFLFFAGHVVFGVGAFIAYERLGKSPRQIVEFGAEKLKIISPPLGKALASAIGPSALKTASLIKLPSLNEWRGPGASPQRALWRPAYNATGKPVSEADIVQGVEPLITATKFPLRTVSVSNTKSLGQAIKNAKPGDAITLKPGIYVFLGRSISVRNSGRADAPIAVRAEKLGTVTLRFDLLEGFLVSAPYWIFENLEIEGICPGDGKCEHAFHVVGKAHSLVIRNNRIHDFNAQLKVNGGRKYVKNNTIHQDWPDYGLIEGNTVTDRRARRTSNPVTKLNINGASEWVVRGNLIGDFEKGGGDKISYAAFMKANGRNGVFENNAVVCHMDTKNTGGIRLGLSFGGGGTGQAYCRDSSCETEHTGGIIRNNVIINCPKDVGIYLNRSKGTQIVNNGIYNTAGVDSRFPTSSAYFANNIMDGRVKNRNGGQSSMENNLILGDGVDLADVFTDALNGNFELVDKKAVVGRGIALKNLGVDFCGAKRKSTAPDLGPVDHTGSTTCDIRNIWK
jgi:hypothetical protein